MVFGSGVFEFCFYTESYLDALDRVYVVAKGTGQCGGGFVWVGAEELFLIRC